MLYEDMTPSILLEAPGCSEMVAVRVLRDVVRDLYATRRLWQHRDTTASVGTDGVLTMTLPDETEVVVIRHVRMPDDSVLEPVGTDALTYELYDTGAPAVVVEINGVWTVRPAPSEVTTVTAVAQITPTAASTGIIDRIAARCVRMYQHFALARLLAMPRQPWSAPNYAALHAAQGAALLTEEMRRADGWSTKKTPVVRYGGI